MCYWEEIDDDVTIPIYSIYNIYITPPPLYVVTQLTRFGVRILGFSDSRILGFSDSRILGFSDSRILGFSDDEMMR